MELDVRLERSDDQAWGFRLIGGAEYNFPLTVAKVQPESLALWSGLQGRDVILEINGSTTSSMTHDTAYEAITQAGDTLFLGVARGLTPEPTMTEYQTMPMQDFVPLSQPYEVQMENRSCTASPFLLPAKPYRPFSAEPVINVPPIESPIILNSNYHDTFARIRNEDDLPDTIFKLPISKQYVPDEEFRRRRAKSESAMKFVKIGHSEKSMEINDLKYVKKMRKEIDIDKIEENATQFVEESIVKAAFATEEIKMDIDKELRIISSTSQSERENKIVDLTLDTAETSKISQKFNDEISTSKEVKTKIDDKFQVKSSSRQMLSENLEINKTEIMKLEATEREATTVKRATEEVNNATINLVDEEKLKTVRNNIELFEEKSVAVENEYNTFTSQNKVVKKAMTKKSFGSEKVESNIELKSNDKKVNQSKCSQNTNTLLDSDTFEATKNLKTMTSSQNDQTVKTSKNISTTNLLAEQRAYILGLQTIPNIRGHVQSSYQYDLLLKTFFIHLTDVMVALSRFILIEVPNSSEKIINTKTEHVTKNTKNINENNDYESRSKQKETVVTHEEIAQVHEKIYDKKISGSKMAQLSSRKSEELTHKMDAVISEFQENVNDQNIETENRTENEQNIERKDRKEINVTEHLDVKRNRRSRSRSQIEEEVAQESDPLDWLEKNSKHEKTIKSLSNCSETIIKDSKITELDTKTINTAKSTKVEVNKKISSAESGKIMYLATVEAHVYTNPDALIEDIIDTSEETESIEVTKLENVTESNEAFSKKTSIDKVCAQEENRIGEESLQVTQNINVKSTTDLGTSIEEIVDMSEKNETQSTETTQVDKIMESTEILVSENISVDNTITQQEKCINVDEKSLDITQEITVKNIEIETNCEEESLHVTQEINVKSATDLEISIEEIVDMSEENETQSKETTKGDKIIESTEILLSENISVNNTITQQEKCINVGKESSDMAQEITVKCIEIETNYESIKTDVKCVEEDTKHTSTNEIVSSDTEYIENIDTREENVNIATDEVSQITEIHVMATEVAEVSNDSIKSESESIVVTQEAISDQKLSETNIEMNENFTMSTPHQESAVEAIICIQENQESIEQTTKKGESDTINIKINQTSLKVSDNKFTEEYSSVESTEIQESSFTAKLIQSSETNETIDRKNLSLIINEPKLKTTIKTNTQDSVENDESTDIDTPTPSTIPPTPLTDEYVFRLQIPLSKSRCVTPEPRELTPPKAQEDHEDPHIVKKKLIPYIETTIESIVYDNIASPNATNTDEPAFSHGLDRGTDKIENDLTEEDIIEIERKSSLLASAIDDTIKSIEMYKQEISADKNINALKQESLAKSELKEKQILIDTETYKSDSSTLNQSNFVQHKDVLCNGDVLKANSIMEKHEIVKTQENQDAEVERVAFDHESREKTNFNINGLSNSCVEYSVNNNEAIKSKVTNSKEVDYEISKSLRNTESSNAIQHSNLIQNVFIHTSTEENGCNNVNQEVFGTSKGIISGIESELIGEDITQELLGKPGMAEDQIAELISGGSEMLREAHVMGLKRVLASHIHRATDDDESVDFNQIKPTIESLRDSAVLKVLNEEIANKKNIEKKTEERKWTTFLQTPNRAVPTAKFGHYVYDEDEEMKEGYKVNIIKQPKPKVAPDYKSKDFETGPLPWEERAAREPPPPPVPREQPILVPEDVPQYLEAIDQLPESAVPDLEDTGILLPPEKEVDSPETIQGEAKEEEELEVEAEVEEEVELELEAEAQTEESAEEMEQNRLAEQVLLNIQSMVDPNASIDQQLLQMRAQLSALAQLPGVIQKTLELVTKQLTTLAFQDTSKPIEKQEVLHENGEIVEEIAEVSQNHQEQTEDTSEVVTENVLEVVLESSQTEIKREESRAEEITVVEERNEIEKKKKELIEEMQQEQESRQLKQRPTPRVGRPKPAFGPLTPQERPMVLPGGRKWRTPKDAYNDQFIAETLTAQSEIIQGKAKGFPYESTYHQPYDERVNFKKYEKPPISLDHLKDSDVYKLVHDMDEAPVGRVHIITPAMAESDYREKCRALTPSINQ